MIDEDLLIHSAVIYIPLGYDGDRQAIYEEIQQRQRHTAEEHQRSTGEKRLPGHFLQLIEERFRV